MRSTAEQFRHAARGANWHRLALGMKLAVTIGVAAYIACQVDLWAVLRAVETMSPGFFAAALASFLLVPMLGGLRWWAVLRGMGRSCRIGSLTSLFSAALVASQVLPSIAGDSLRVWLTARRGYPLSVAIHSILFERAGMVATLLTLVAATEPLLARRIDVRGTAWIAPLLLAVAALALGLLIWIGRPGERRLLPRPLIALAADARRVTLSRWALVVALVSLASNLNFVLAALLLARALDLPVSGLDLLACIPLVTVAATLPISFGGWGVREGMLVAMLGALGVPAAGALALSLGFGALGAVCGLPGLLAGRLGRHRSALRGPALKPAT